MNMENVMQELCSATGQINTKYKTSYKVGSYVGSGGFSYVFNVSGINDGNEYVIKYTPRKPEYENDKWDDICSRKDHEIAVLTGSDIDERLVPKIVSAYTDRDENGSIAGYITIERKLVSLEHWLKKNGYSQPLADERAILAIMSDLLEAMDYMHAHMDMIHEDIKPENIMFDPFYSRFKLIDFNTSRGSEIDTDLETTCPGITQRFTAPEYLYATRMNYSGRMEEHFSKAMDVYALGATAFYWITGEYTVDIKDGLYYEKSKQDKKKALIRANVDPLLRQVILHAIDEDPGRRYQSAEEMLDEVRGVLLLTRFYDEEERDETSETGAEMHGTRKKKGLSYVGMIAMLTTIGIYLCSCFLLLPVPGADIVNSSISTFEEQMMVWLMTWAGILMLVFELISRYAKEYEDVLCVVCLLIALAGASWPILPFSARSISFTGSSRLSGERCIVKAKVKPVLCSHAMLGYRIDDRAVHWSGNGLIVYNSGELIDSKRITVTNGYDRSDSSSFFFDNRR